MSGLRLIGMLLFFPGAVLIGLYVYQSAYSGEHVADIPVSIIESAQNPDFLERRLRRLKNIDFKNYTPITSDMFQLSPDMNPIQIKIKTNTVLKERSESSGRSIYGESIVRLVDAKSPNNVFWSHKGLKRANQSTRSFGEKYSLFTIKRFNVDQPFTVRVTGELNEKLLQRRDNKVFIHLREKAIPANPIYLIIGGGLFLLGAIILGATYPYKNRHS